MNMTTSESCSIEPDSRRSASCGRLSSRCSTARESCEQAITGTSNSLAIAFRPRVMSETSWTRFSMARLCAEGDVCGERCLAHRRAAGEDDQIGGMQPAELLVEIDKVRRDADRLAVTLERGFRHRDCAGQRARERLRPAFRFARRCQLK